jgi:FKBP-type peptidyl-prolyl cis-trans isomerase SlpA
MEELLLGMTAGRRETFELAPGIAFGERKPELVQRVARSLLAQLADEDAAFEVGDVVQFPRPDGEAGFAGMVRELGDDWLLFDFNHPLAGQRVTFEVELIEVL